MNDLILLHAALGSEAQLANLKELLSQTRTVHSLNFEGHGGRPSDRSFSMKHFTQNVLDFMQENAISQADFFGYSMGGYVALSMALRNPERVGKIVTLGTKFDWTEASYLQQERMLNPEKIEAKVPAFANLLKRTHAPNDWKMVLRKTAAMMKKLSDGDRLKESDFQRMEVPVLITVGDKDHMVSIEESERVAGWLPQASFRVLQGVEHDIEKTDPKRLEEVITGLLARA